MTAHTSFAVTAPDDICDLLIFTLGAMGQACCIPTGDPARDERSRIAFRNGARLVRAVSALRHVACEHRGEFVDALGPEPFTLERLT